ncbi:MAG: FkbM family methyltransferase [Proteobacteria bacterium]|jgi:FkbM family methyltransferase|nr:FkbM family methyltransferase [Pseudomonadota bacterium]
MLNTLRYITAHPLNKKHKTAAVMRWLRWQLRSRLTSDAVIVDFVGDSRLRVKSGMTGATGNIYCGLHEFEDMSFLLHFLRPGDLFVDIGANIGSYTVLASKVAGAHTITIEPVPSAFAALTDNILLNDIQGRVRTENFAVGSENRMLTFSLDRDTGNHAIPEKVGYKGSTTTVACRRLDDLLDDEVPKLIKIDVEGFETEVINGAEKIISNPECVAVIMELIGEGEGYGYSEKKLHEKMLSYGFEAYKYLPFTREIRALEISNREKGNVLYLKSVSDISERLVSAPTLKILGNDV